jgi:murein DD-endopeptidase MepM/ murein hydrolase activator NlpD
MRHNLAALDGDVRKAMAAYNAGLGRVRSLVEAHGENWERGLPAETKQYLANILGPSSPRVSAGGEAAVFGGRGPHGVMTQPLDQVRGQQRSGNALDLLGSAGAEVRAPADGRVKSVSRLDGVATVLLDHGNGWQTSLRGIDVLEAAEGDAVRRGQTLGRLPSTVSSPPLRLGVALEGRALDPTRYLLRT